MRDRLPEQEANIALLIDADNASPEHLDEVLLVLGELGTINIRRAYGNWAWRVRPDQLHPDRFAWLADLTETYGRVPSRGSPAAIR